MQCKCGSYAINHHLHGRDGTDRDLCDVCYWRKRADPDLRTVLGYDAGMRHAAHIAQRVKAPASIGKDRGRHHEAGAQAAAKAILEAMGGRECSTRSK